MNSEDTRREVRFYVTLSLGYGLMILGCLLPPLGVIKNSVLFGSGMILALAAMIVGIDLTKVIRELRQLNRELQAGLKDEEKEIDA